MPDIPEQEVQPPERIEELPPTLTSSQGAYAQPNRRSRDSSSRQQRIPCPSYNVGVEAKELRAALLAMAPRAHTNSRDSLSEYTDVPTPLSQSQSSYVPSMRHSLRSGFSRPTDERGVADTGRLVDLPGTSTGQSQRLSREAVSQRLVGSSRECTEEPPILIERHLATHTAENDVADKVWCPSPWGQLCTDLNGQGGKQAVDVNVVRDHGEYERGGGISSIGTTSLAPTAPATPSVSSASSFRESGFQVLLGKDIHLDSFGQHMLFSDLKACKRLCKNRGYGAFVISGGRVFFKQQSVQQCQEYLVDRKGCTAYLNATANIGIRERHRSGKEDLPKQTEGEVPYQKDGTVSNTGVVHCPIFCDPRSLQLPVRLCPIA